MIMNKLYHLFYVSDYKGGELHSYVNLSIEEVASSIIDGIDWDEISDRCADNEKFANMEDEEFFALTCVQLLDIIDDESLKDIAYDKAYPGNTYAFDSCSDYEIYTMDKNGKLSEVDITNEPGFIEAFRKVLLKSAEWTDKYREKYKK